MGICVATKSKAWEDRQASPKIGTQIGGSKEHANPITPQTSQTPRSIDFGDNPTGKLIKVLAILESLRVDGGDCDWVLKVDQKDVHKCLTFISQMLDNAEWRQVMGVIQDLLTNESFFVEHGLGFSKIQRLSEEIAGYT